MLNRYTDAQPFVTKDGSIIRELMHPNVHGNCHQSLAEATIEAGGITALHQHFLAEEIYYFIAGTGRMTLGSEVFAVAPGDTVCIAPGVPHRLENTGAEPLRLLCCSSPAYRHEDTELLTEIGDENDGG